MDQRGREVEGRSGVVQLCWGSAWSTVCRNDRWNIYAWNIVCGQLGYREGCETRLIPECLCCIQHMILCAAFNTTDFYTSDSTVEQNPLIEATVDVWCQRGEPILTNCSINQPNNGCYINEFYRYAYITCTEGKNLEQN